jgi:hypothetical protein
MGHGSNAGGIDILALLWRRIVPRIALEHAVLANIN